MLPRRFFTPPNQLTFLRILLTPVFVAMFLSPDARIRQWSVAVFFVSMLTDLYDGWVARRWGFVTRWGSFLDPFADKVFISATLFAFLAGNLVPAWTVWVIVVRDVGITALRSYSELKGRAFVTSQFAKTKTFLQFAVIYYLLLLHIARTTFPPDAVWQPTVATLLARPLTDAMMGVVALITLVTGILYMMSNRSTLRELYGLSD